MRLEVDRRYITGMAYSEMAKEESDESNESFLILSVTVPVVTDRREPMARSRGPEPYADPH